MSDVLVTAEIQQSEIERMTRIVNAVVARLDKQAENIIRQGMIWAVQSAARETAPGRAASPSKLADKFKYRPITRYHGSLNRYAYEVNGKTRVWETERRLSKKSLEKSNKRRLTREIELWSKAAHALVKIPYTGPATSGKYDKTSRIGRILHAGAGKACWLKALGKLPGGKPDPASESAAAPRPHVQVAKSEGEIRMIVENTVRYVDITSPGAAARATTSAANRMAKYYSKLIPELEKEINRI